MKRKESYTIDEAAQQLSIGMCQFRALIATGLIERPTFQTPRIDDRELVRFARKEHFRLRAKHQ